VNGKFQYKQDESEWRGLCPVFPKADINQKRGYDQNAAKSDISSRFKRRVEDHRRSKGRLALLSRPVTRQEVADHRNAAIVGGVVGYPPGFHNDIDYLAPLIL